MKIKLVERANPQNRKESKWYANAVNAGTKSIRDIAAGIAGRSSLTRGDVENVLSNFVDELPGYLKDGFSLQLGELGTLRLSLASEGAKTPEEFNTKSITSKVIFTPSVMMKRELESISFERVPVDKP